MKEGYWINYETESIFLIDEHEQWIRRDGNAHKLGISASTMRTAISQYTQFTDRNAFLTYLMRHAPIMRVRGHVDMVTFEFHSEGSELPIRTISKFGEDYLGPHSVLNIFNFASNTTWRGQLSDLAKACCADCLNLLEPPF